MEIDGTQVRLGGIVLKEIWTVLSCPVSGLRCEVIADNSAIVFTHILFGAVVIPCCCH